MLLEPCCFIGSFSALRLVGLILPASLYPFQHFVVEMDSVTSVWSLLNPASDTGAPYHSTKIDYLYRELKNALWWGFQALLSLRLQWCEQGQCDVNSLAHVGYFVQ